VIWIASICTGQVISKAKKTIGKLKIVIKSNYKG
jgi:hypothetical protein